MESRTYNIVVAVPTKKRLAFTLPGLRGWIFVSLASGSELATWAPDGRSRVGALALLGSISRCFIVLSLYVVSAAAVQSTYGQSRLAEKERRRRQVIWVGSGKA